MNEYMLLITKKKPSKLSFDSVENKIYEYLTNKKLHEAVRLMDCAQEQYPDIGPGGQTEDSEETDMETSHDTMTCLKNLFIGKNLIG